ncbi:MAG TPA: hypothetical protein VKE41_15620 [Roseiflexaceae bacterium]|nr:hypothetical protein [Roseiflexaceae bacterium]
MILEPHETQRFYRIWFPLLHYVNEQRNLVPDLPASPVDGAISPNDAYKVSSALWADDGLRHRFIAENPFDMPPEDLALIASWDSRVAGDFYVFRHLKKYSVFIGQRPSDRVYGVLGLVSPFEDVLPLPPPVLVRAVLLPFEGRITYDGLFSTYNIFFGAGIRGNLNDIYRNAKERGQIITSLGSDAAPADPAAARKDVQGRNDKLLTAFRRALAGSNLSMKMIEQHTANIAAFADGYLLAQQPPRGLLDLNIDDMRGYVGGADLKPAARKTNMTSFKRFVRFLYDTGRMDNDTARHLLDSLRHYES